MNTTFKKSILALALCLTFALGAQDFALASTPQTTCPVMGGTINKQLFGEYDGKRVYFCCAGCSAVFERNPAAYIEKLEAQGVELEKVE